MGALNPGDVIKDHKEVLLPLLGAVVLIIGVGYYFDKGGDFLTGSQIMTPAGLGGGAKKEYESYPNMIIDDEKGYTATIKTNEGDIVVELYPQIAPKTVNNFVFLSKEEFYNGLIFHRVIDGFMIQGGDPGGDGKGGPGYTFNDEINPDSLGLDKILVKDSVFLSNLYNPYDAASSGYAPNSLREHENSTLADFYDDMIGYNYDYSLNSVKFGPGVIAMANAGPGTNGSQFFITVSNSSADDLNGRHTVFGKVLEGIDIVDKIAGVLVDTQSKPVDDIVIETISIEEK